MLSSGDPDIVESVNAHITRHIASVDMVFHEIISLDLHIDMHWVKPARDRPFHTLVTSGMSERPMHTPSEATDFRFAELTILLDAKWPVDHARFSDENVYWPIRLLKTLARYPFEAETWLGMGHSIAANDPPATLAPATELSSVILLPPLSLGEDFMCMPRPDGTSTYFWTVLPIYTDELAFKIEKGSDALMDALDAVGVDDVVRQERPRATGRKKFLGLF